MFPFEVSFFNFLPATFFSFFDSIIRWLNQKKKRNSEFHFVLRFPNPFFYFASQQNFLHFIFKYIFTSFTKYVDFFDFDCPSLRSVEQKSEIDHSKKNQRLPSSLMLWIDFNWLFSFLLKSFFFFPHTTRYHDNHHHDKKILQFQSIWFHRFLASTTIWIKILRRWNSSGSNSIYIIQRNY